MNRSEKLLEAIGQIDDRLILDAQKAGSGSIHGAAVRRRAASGKKSGRKKVSAFRYRNALAACAALLVCIGVYGLLAKEVVLLSPFEKKSDNETKIVAEMEEAAVKEAVSRDGTVEEAAPAQVQDAVGTGDANGMGAGKSPEEAAVTGETEQEEASAETAKQTDREAAARENGEAAANGETDSEAALTEAFENSSEEATETEGESSGEAQQEASQEPMILSLRPEEEVSDNDIPEICELPAAAIKSEWVKTAGTDVTVKYSNQHSDAALQYGSRYGLEYQTADGWETIPVKENVGWEDILYELEPGKSAKETVKLDSVFGTLKSGHYRLIKNAALVYTDQTEDEIVLYTEFDLE